MPHLPKFLSIVAISLALVPITARASTSPIQLVEFLEGGTCETVAIGGTTLYTEFSGVFLAVDVSDPYNPTRLSFLDAPANIWDIELAGSYAYVVLDGGVIDIVDITDPASPVVSASMTTGDVDEFVISSGLGFGVEGWDGVRIYDMSNPLAPAQLSVIPSVSGAQDIAIQGNYAYIAESGQGIQVIDITNPSAPTEVGSYTNNSFTIAVAVSGNYAYIGSIFTPGRGFWIADIQDPTNPFEVAFRGSSIDHMDVVVEGNIVYTLGYDGTVSVYDVSAPSAPVRIGTEYVGGGLELALSGNMLYTANWDEGFSVVDISNPDDPATVSNYGSIGRPNGLIGRGANLHLNQGAWVTTMDRHSLTVRSEIGAATYNSTIEDMELEGSFLYLATCDSWYLTDGGLRILDVSDPIEPEYVAAYPPIFQGGCYGRVTAYQDRAYLLSGWTVLIIDVSSPATPVELGTYTFPGGIADLDADGNYLYLATGTNGVRVVDVSDPLNPFEVGSHVAGTASDIVLSGQYVFVGEKDWSAQTGLRILDISNPANPVEVSTYTMNSIVRGVTVSGNNVYLTGPRLVVLDVSDIQNPVEIATCDTWDTGRLAAAMPPLLYVTWGGTHMVVYSVDVPTAVNNGNVPPSFSLSQNYPNPFNPRTAIAYSIPTRSQVDIRVYTVKGELVRTLWSGEKSVGDHLIEWDGRDRSGSLVSSGIYLVRLQADDKSLTKRMVLLK